MLLPTRQNTKTITDLREDALGVLSDVDRLGLVYVLQHSDPRAVVLSLKEFTRICELIEDRADERDAAELSSEDRGIGIPLSTIAKKYQ
ncbi:hypothetical protein A2971_03175 [Candidatus Gottesmanbacteria bacterium RIFCSPLOWO2_01_FULL_46_21]|uniref:Antitoxin n=2 Tax=Candidatus Gottesmaniibacteriota TaxID=1752720 RepID=A0A0G1TG47_9BACT|nr:MAG: hypothetical protein UY08_C0009G0003 [Candidatus Gottesmanbacteria bacterium GW2011_GWA1_47_8]OGG28670.1 MAG: hypothetical protein A2971_03175 [Candidatus Gottesmanbacteria bacterium RIFCSPLOWO2_01_FULL_46_21]